MISRDKRALIILILWASLVAVFFVSEYVIKIQKKVHDNKYRIEQINRVLGSGRQELAKRRNERAALMNLLPRDFSGLTEDQLRLKGQDGILAVMHRNGVKNIRLRTDPAVLESWGRKFQWTVEGEGSLAQWVDSLQQIEQCHPLMAIQNIELNLVGDPWAPEGGTPEFGPSIQGKILCSWMVLQ